MYKTVRANKDWKFDNMQRLFTKFTGVVSTTYRLDRGQWYLETVDGILTPCGEDEVRNELELVREADTIFVVYKTRRLWRVLMLEANESEDAYALMLLAIQDLLPGEKIQCSDNLF